MERAISRSQAALVNLAKTIDGYYYAPTRNAITQQRLINDDSQGAVDALVQGTESLSIGPTVDRLEKPRMVVQAKELLDQIRKTSDAWVRAKTLIVGNGGRQAIGEVVKKQGNAANNFAATLVSKMPGGQTDSLAGWYAKEVNQAVAKAVAAYN